MCVLCVRCNSLVVYILILSWGSLHTPCRNQFAHSRPPAATATSSQCWVAWESLGGGSWCAHTCTRRDTRSEKYYANAGNDKACPLVNVPPNSFKWNTQCFRLYLALPDNKQALFVTLQSKNINPLHVNVYTCPCKYMLLCDRVFGCARREMFFTVVI